VVLLTGDLALLHDMGGLAAIAQLSLDLTVVVVNNGGGGIFEFLPIAAHATAFKPHFLTPQTTRIDKLCEAVGASHSRATNLAELHGLLERALTRPGLSVVEAIVDRADNVARHRKAFRTVDWTLTTWLRASVKRITERIT